MNSTMLRLIILPLALLVILEIDFSHSSCRSQLGIEDGQECYYHNNKRAACKMIPNKGKHYWEIYTEECRPGEKFVPLIDCLDHCDCMKGQLVCELKGKDDSNCAACNVFPPTGKWVPKKASSF